MAVSASVRLYDAVIAVHERRHIKQCPTSQRPMAERHTFHRRQHNESLRVKTMVALASGQQHSVAIGFTKTCQNVASDYDGSTWQSHTIMMAVTGSRIRLCWQSSAVTCDYDRGGSHLPVTERKRVSRSEMIINVGFT